MIPKPTATISLTCPKGHRLRAPQKAAGRTLPCPICQQPVVVAADIDSPSQSGIMSAVGKVDDDSTRGLDAAPTVRKQTISDTGVMRILSESGTQLAAKPIPEVPNMRDCPKCGVGVPETSSVCTSCRCYLGPAPNYLQTL